MESKGQSHIKERFNVKEPTLYDVIMLNDDFTTMEFVVMVLHHVFYYDDIRSERMMMEIHQRGQCVVGTFTLDIAQSKVNKVKALARKEGFPLRLKIKEHQ